MTHLGSMIADLSSIAAALLGGVLSFLSPCVLPLVPPYLFYLAGASIERLADNEPPPLVRRETVLAAALFVAGFSTVFVALGATASAIGRLLHAWSYELSIVAGVVIIFMGLHFLGLTRFTVLMFEKRAPMSRPVGLWGAYVMGLAFAFGWSPCIGPALTTIMSIAASKDTVAQGAGLLAVYSAGLGIPFIVAALAVEPVTAFLARFKRHMEIVEKAMGGLLVLTGIAFLFGFVSEAGSYLLDWFPALGNIG
jgi:cytochrome c-type biogenesis protein